jgi:hypothetical protein
MTNEQLKAIGYAVIDIGDAIHGVEVAFHNLGNAILDATPPPVWPIDPPPPPPIDPPPPVDPPPQVESEFMRAVVLDEKFEARNRYEPGEWAMFGPDPLFNPFGESFGVSFQFVYNAPPNMASPLSLRNDENPFFQLFARGPTALGVVWKPTSGEYQNFDVVVDDMVGRPVHTVFDYDADDELAAFYVDGVLREATVVPGGIGLFPDRTPPLIINSTVAGHQSGDITPIRLVYAVGAAPTQADVSALSGIVPHEPGFFQSIEGEEVVVSAFGEGFADKPLHDPKPFLDGRFVEVKQTRNNPPLLKEWRGQVPGDVGREIQ